MEKITSVITYGKIIPNTIKIVVPSTQEAKAGGSLKSRSLRLAWVI
jgi:hypothetical protein